MPTNRQVSMAEVLSAAIRSTLGDHYHCLPGIVQTYYPATEEADVQIAINDPRSDPDSDEVTTEPWQVWPKMKVAWLKFGGYVIQGPLANGAKVQVLWNDLDDSAFRASGQQGDPPMLRRHGTEGAFCIPFDLTDMGVSASAGTAGSSMVVGNDASSAKIVITSSGISIGASATDFVALSSKVESELTKVATAFSTFVPGSGGASFPHPYTTPAAGVTAASLTKAQ